ncbi:MAG: HPP family protein [Gammaproteobacteria bacterium]
MVVAGFPLRSLLREVRLFLGIGSDATSHREKWLSGLGALIGMLVLAAACQWWVPLAMQPLMIASVGATAVLLFAVPHGALSQPWAVVGGYAVSALLGVFCQQQIPHEALAMALAVGGSVVAMYYLRCLHPPGGAAALIAVTGGSEVEQLGYLYVLIPALFNAGVLVLAAVVFNVWFPWRRYPAHLLHPQLRPTVPAPAVRLSEDDFTHALQQMDTYVDITPEELHDLYERACEHALQNRRRGNR